MRVTLPRQVVEELGLAIGTVLGDQIAGVVIAVVQPRGVLQVAQRIARSTPYDLFLGDFAERVVDCCVGRSGPMSSRS